MVAPAQNVAQLHPVAELREHVTHEKQVLVLDTAQNGFGTIEFARI
jgi:hypothetical protein